MDRREFLGMFCVGVGNEAIRKPASFLISIFPASQSSVKHEKNKLSRREFLGLKEGKSADKIKQIGITHIELDGHKYQISVNTADIKELTVELAKTYPEGAVQKVETWLRDNDLLINFYNKITRPLDIMAAATFAPPWLNGGTAQVGIPDDTLISLLKYQQAQEPNEKEKFSVICLPHELKHLIDYILDPQKMAVLKTVYGVETLISGGIAMLDKMANENKGHKSKLLFYARFIQMNLLFNVGNLIFGLTEHDQTFDEKSISKLLDENPKIKELSLSSVAFHKDK